MYIFFPEMPVVHKEFTHELLTPKEENLSMAKEHTRKRRNMNKQIKKLPIFTISERRVGENLGDTFKKIKGRIIIATFASNVHRVQ